MFNNCCVFIILVILINNIACHNKYSAAANAKKDSDVPPSLKTLDQPFRMAKINKLWAKAQIASIINLF